MDVRGDDDASGLVAGVVDTCEDFDGMNVRPCADGGDSHVTEVESGADRVVSNLLRWVASVRLNIIIRSKTRAYVELDSIDETWAIVEAFTSGRTSLAGM